MNATVTRIGGSTTSLRIVRLATVGRGTNGMRRIQELQCRSSSSSVNCRDSSVAFPHTVVPSQLHAPVSFHGCCQRNQPQFKLVIPMALEAQVATCSPVTEVTTTPSVSLHADLRQLSSSAGNWRRNQAAEGVRAGGRRDRKNLKFGVFICFFFDVISRADILSAFFYTPW